MARALACPCIQNRWLLRRRAWYTTSTAHHYDRRLRGLVLGQAGAAARNLGALVRGERVAGAGGAARAGRGGAPRPQAREPAAVRARLPSPGRLWVLQAAASGQNPHAVRYASLHGSRSDPRGGQRPTHSLPTLSHGPKLGVGQGAEGRPDVGWVAARRGTASRWTGGRWGCWCTRCSRATAPLWATTPRRSTTTFCVRSSS
jgi:hypothetical protein